MPRIPYHQHTGHDDGGALSVTRSAATAGGDVAAEAAARAAADAAHAASADPHPALLSNPMTTAGDLILGGAAGAPGRLGVGTDSHVLTVDSGTHLPAWKAATGGASVGTATPLVESGAGSAGTAAAASREDHVHPAASGSGTLSTVEEADGSPTDSAVTKLVFPNGTLSIASHVATYTPAASGATIQYPALKPATPTYDFAGAALDGAFTAHSSGGSFATSSCMTQGVDGSHLELQYSAQMGGLHVSHADADLDFSVGGLQARAMGVSNTATPFMMGIAALNSSGTGVGVLVYTDGNCYIATITAWNYASNSDSWANKGISTTASGVQGDWWLRLKRVSGTWTGYASTSGRAWDKTFTTRSDSITVDRLYVGLLYNTASTYSGRVLLDWLHVAV